MLCADARAVWNLGVEQFEFAARYRPYRTGRRVQWPSHHERDRQLTEARRVEGWIGDGSRMVQTQALRDLEQAFQNWWKRPDHFRRPTFRSAKDGGGFNVTDLAERITFRKMPDGSKEPAGVRLAAVSKINRRWATIRVPTLGVVRFRLTRPFDELRSAKSARVTVDKIGRWHVSFLVELRPVNRTPTGRSVGVDRGVKNSLATSDGMFEHAPTLSPGEQDEFLRRQIAFSTADRNDPLRRTHHQAIRRTHARLRDRRKNWIEQTTTDLIRQYDLIVVERLNVAGMTRSAAGTVDDPGVNVRAKAGLNRAILAQCWSEWLTRLKQKAELSNVTVIEVPARNTSRRCHHCKRTHKNNRENQASFLCVHCGHEDHADINAAKNILEKAGTRPEPLEPAA